MIHPLGDLALFRNVLATCLASICRFGPGKHAVTGDIGHIVRIGHIVIVRIISFIPTKFQISTLFLAFGFTMGLFELFCDDFEKVNLTGCACATVRVCMCACVHACVSLCMFVRARMCVCVCVY